MVTQITTNNKFKACNIFTTQLINYQNKTQQKKKKNPTTVENYNNVFCWNITSLKTIIDNYVAIFHHCDKFTLKISKIFSKRSIAIIKTLN